jgi:hypothetical protein
VDYISNPLYRRDNVIYYAIKIDNKYLKGYEYATKEDVRRYAGNATVMGLLREGDIKDIIVTDTPERTETRRSVGNTITTLYTIEKLRDKSIEIVPVEEGR